MIRVARALEHVTSILALLSALLQLTASMTADPVALFDRGRTMEQFAAAVTAQRELWVKNVSSARTESNTVDRFKRVSKGLRLLVVAEDWCPDSVNTVPYIAALASQAGVDLRIVDRADGQPLMKRHPAPDGRTVTPTVVLLRHGRDVGAWVERPAVLQKLFQSMATNPESAQRFAQRQAWYDADHGRTTLAEIVVLAGQTAGGR